MCIVKYIDCPGCYGLHNNQIIEFERCMRQIHVKWGLPFPKDGRIRHKDDGPCPSALHVGYTLYETGEWTAHKHFPGLIDGQLEFTGNMSDLEIFPTEMPVNTPLEEEEKLEFPGDKWFRSFSNGNLAVDRKQEGSLDDPVFWGARLEMFTENLHKSKDQQLDENRLLKANSPPKPKRPDVVEWAGKTFYFPRPLFYDPNPPRRTVTKASVEVSEAPAAAANDPPELEVQPTSRPSPKVEPKLLTKTKRTYTKRGGKQQPSPPASPPTAAKKPEAKSRAVKIPARKTSQRTPTREKKEARRRGRPLGVKNGAKKARSAGKERPPAY